MSLSTLYGKNFNAFNVFMKSLLLQSQLNCVFVCLFVCLWNLSNVGIRFTMWLLRETTPSQVDHNNCNNSDYNDSNNNKDNADTY